MHESIHICIFVYIDIHTDTRSWVEGRGCGADDDAEVLSLLALLVLKYQY
jgi:hypothetical protein